MSALAKSQPRIRICSESPYSAICDRGCLLLGAAILRRRFDIAEASGLTEERIPASGVSLDELNENIEKFVDLVVQRKSELVQNKGFTQWDYEHRFTAAPHLEAGFIDIGTHSAFRTHKDALNCFGYNKGHLQKAVWTLPQHVASAIGLTGSCVIWFPKLYEQKDWKNSLSEDGLSISEMNKDPEHDYVEKWDKHIVFAHSRDELNRTLYRFVGVFEIIPEFSTGHEHRFRRIATRVKTFQD